jgi:transglutaminase-like putative cysteine protease
MLKLSAPQASLNQLGTSSLKQVMIAVPLTIVLFYVFPRLANPLWQVPSLIQAKIGFSETMNPGSIGSLFDDDSIAFRVLFKDTPITNGYWKGLIFAFYNGNTWSPSWHISSAFPPLQELNNNENADYEVVMEPHQKKWLFYLGYPKYAYPDLLFSSDVGLVSQSKDLINQRFAYSIVTVSEPIKSLTSKDLKLNTQLPKYLNPQIIQWSKEQFAKTENNPNRFIAFLKDYIQHEEFWYTLNPPELSNRSNQIDEFWFTSRKGFCEHYASAVTVILRSAGIPARVVVGYQGGEWNPFAKYLTVKQKNAHAWLEYWTSNQGWQNFDPTTYISPTRIDKQLLTNSAEQKSFLNLSTMSWWQRTKLMLESFNFFVERWFLFYNLDAQRDLLDNLGLSNWGFSQLLQIAAFSLVIFIILLGLLYWWQQRKTQDPIQTQYRLLKKELHRFHVYGLPSTTLKMACSQLQTSAPDLNSIIESFINKYEDLRLCHPTGNRNKNTKETVALFKAFRRQLASIKVKAKVCRKVI